MNQFSEEEVNNAEGLDIERYGEGIVSSLNPFNHIKWIVKKNLNKQDTIKSQEMADWMNDKDPIELLSDAAKEVQSKVEKLPDDPPSTINHDPFLTLLEYFDAQIAKAILGETNE